MYLSQIQQKDTLPQLNFSKSIYVPFLASDSLVYSSYCASLGCELSSRIRSILIHTYSSVFPSLWPLVSCIRVVYRHTSNPMRMYCTCAEGRPPWLDEPVSPDTDYSAKATSFFLHKCTKKKRLFFLLSSMLAFSTTSLFFNLRQLTRGDAGGVRSSASCLAVCAKIATTPLRRVLLACSTTFFVQVIMISDIPNYFFFCNMPQYLQRLKLAHTMSPSPKLSPPSNFDRILILICEGKKKKIKRVRFLFFSSYWMALS